MNEQELKALVREAIARHMGEASAEAQTSGRVPTAHPSFHRYALPSGSDMAGPCLIEPAVRCSHCGYCQSHGY
jgi:hypothetical protein